MYIHTYIVMKTNKIYDYNNNYKTDMAKQIYDYLKENYPNTEVTKQSLRATFNLPYNRAVDIFGILATYSDCEVTNRTVTVVIEEG